MPMQLEIGTLYRDEGVEHLVYQWAPAAPDGGGS
jgi:hypothetical protein